jgi:hypothetical protein
MKVYLVVEDYDSGPGIASLNICNIFSTEERAIEKRDEIIKHYEDICGIDYVDEYLRENVRVEEWEVEE